MVGFEAEAAGLDGSSLVGPERRIAGENGRACYDLNGFDHTDNLAVDHDLWRGKASDDTGSVFVVDVSEGCADRGTDHFEV